MGRNICKTMDSRRTFNMLQCQSILTLIIMSILQIFYQTSPSLEQWIYEYDKQAHRTKYGRFPTGPPPSSKSVVVHYLSQTSISVKDVLKQLSTGFIPYNWRVMVAVAKEREFKYKDARFYGKMCFETLSNCNGEKHC